MCTASDRTPDRFASSLQGSFDLRCSAAFGITLCSGSYSLSMFELEGKVPLTVEDPEYQVQTVVV